MSAEISASYYRTNELVDDAPLSVRVHQALGNLRTPWTPFATPRRAGAYGPTAPYSSPTPALPHRSPARYPIEEPRADQKPGTPRPHTCLRARTVTSTINMSSTRGSGMFWGKIPMARPVEVASGAGFTRI